MAQILIADDEPDIRDLLTATLSNAGHELTEAEDGAAVLVRLAYPRPDLILMDLHMPVLDGLGALKRLRTVDAWDDVPVLFLTASGLIDDMVTARRLGARGYLVKPLRPRELLAKVELVLSDKSLTWLDDLTQARSGG